MKVIYEKTIEVNNQLKVNVDEQQDDIKYLKEQCNKDATLFVLPVGSKSSRPLELEIEISELY